MGTFVAVPIAPLENSCTFKLELPVENTSEADALKLTVIPLITEPTGMLGLRLDLTDNT
jgi:hypothetical protein